MCRREIESWSCGCEVGATTPCDYPTLACRSGAFFAPRIDHPYACADCSRQNVRTGYDRIPPTTSPRKKRSSSRAQNDDPRAYAQRVTEKRFSRPADLDLNLSLPPKRSRVSRQKWSSDAPQLIGRPNNAIQALDYGDVDMEFSSRLANPAQDLAAIAMPGALPVVSRSPNSRRPRSGGNVRRIGSVVTHRSTKRSPTFPTTSSTSPRSPISPCSPRSADTMRGVSPRQTPTTYAEPQYQHHQHQHQYQFQNQYQHPQQQAYQQQPFQQPHQHQQHQYQYQVHPQPQPQPQPQRQVHFDLDGHPTYASLKDSVEREIYSGHWTRTQIQAWHHFNMLKPQDQYELLHTYADSMAGPAPTQQAAAAMQSRKKAKPVGRSEKYPNWQSWSNWFRWRK